MTRFPGSPMLGSCSMEAIAGIERFKVPLAGLCALEALIPAISSTTSCNDLIDADTGVILFSATSHPGRSSTEITVAKRSEGAQAQHTPVAKLCFREMFSDTVAFLGEGAKKMKAKEYVRSKGKGRWEVTSTAGDVYTWSEANYKDLKLHSATSVELAHLRAPQHGDAQPTSFFTLQIDDTAGSLDLERIVVSCLYLKHVLKKTAQVGQQMGTAMANPVGNVRRIG